MAEDPIDTMVFPKKREETKEQFESRMIGHGWCPKCLSDLKNISDDITTVDLVCTRCGHVVEEFYV